MEGVRGIAAMRGGIGERRDHLLEFDDRAGPAMGDDQRQCVRLFRTHVQKMDVEPVDLGRELVEAIELCLAPTPVIFVGPIVADLPDPLQRYALAPVIHQLRLRPARACEPYLKVGEDVVADRDAKRFYGVGHRFAPSRHSGAMRSIEPGISRFRVRAYTRPGTTAFASPSTPPSPNRWPCRNPSGRRTWPSALRSPCPCPS